MRGGLGSLILLVCCAAGRAYNKQSARFLYEAEFHASSKFSIYRDYFDESKMAYKTRAAQKMIHDHQNPSDCSSREVRLWATEGFANVGLGAEVIGIASHLSHAMQSGAVLVWGRTKRSKYISDGDADCKGFPCLFQPLSRCEANLTAAALDSLPSNNEIMSLFVIPAHVETWMHKHMPTITHAQALYWWKAQSIAYVMRLSNKSLESVKHFRFAQLDMHEIYSHSVCSQSARNKGRVLPAGTVNIHIRHGDKTSEMNLVSIEEYGKAYHGLTASQVLSFMGERWVHVSSDTLQSIKEMKEWLLVRNHTKTVVYSLMPRMDAGFDSDVWDAFPAAAQNKTRSTLLMLTELLMALEADAWIGTRVSCWGRIIDMLRCVWADKCNAPYVEVGDQRGGAEDHHMYHEFVVPQHAPRVYGKQKRIWAAPPSAFHKTDRAGSILT